jgi:hypothetical protein
MRARLLIAPLLLIGCLAACGDDGDGSNDEAEIKTTVTDVLDAEGDGDAERLVAHFTDDGLQALYGSTREEILAPDYGLGEDGAGKLRKVTIKIDGDKAVATSDVQFGHGLMRVPLDLVREDDAWLVDGVGSFDAPPAPAGVPDVNVEAVDYGFEADTSKFESGLFRISFHNGGKEAHEMALFRVPTGTAAKDGAAAIATVHGDSYDNVPAGYEAVDHITYADPGDDGAYLFADRLEAGDYAFVCLIPAGGFDPETHEPIDPNGTPHVALGMYAPFTVGG